LKIRCKGTKKIAIPQIYFNKKHSDPEIYFVELHSLPEIVDRSPVEIRNKKSLFMAIFLHISEKNTTFAVAKVLNK
jgi:hypothetical protein